jgi:hypothetical protein
VHRVMNLTHFSCLRNSGRHLIIVQTRSKKAEPFALFQELQKEGLISQKAMLLQHEFCVYERYNSIQQILHELGRGKERLEMLEIERFTDLSQSVSKWKNLSQ